MHQELKPKILAEDELRQRNDELKQQFVECTWALRESEAALRRTEDQLHHAQRVATVGRLTGCIAHDFNNLLTVILGNVELALARLPDDCRELAPLLEAAEQAASRGAELTKRLLAFSRKQTLEPRIVDLNEVVSGLSRLLPRVLGETIAVEVVPAPGGLRSLVDTAQLESALLNLAVNSRDAMPEGGKLTIRCSQVRVDEHDARRHPDAAPGDYVRVAVSDTGAGMSAEVAAQAFEPFFTTKSAGNGSGLGLSTVYGFVKQSGGYVGLETTPGRGTRVELNLPRVDKAPAVTQGTLDPPSIPPYNKAGRPRPSQRNNTS